MTLGYNFTNWIFKLSGDKPTCFQSDFGLACYNQGIRTLPDQCKDEILPYKDVIWINTCYPKSQ